MDRDAGSVRLSTKGQELLYKAREVLGSAEQFLEAADYAALYDGVLRLGVTEMVAHTWLRDYLKVLKDRFPQTLVELSVDISVNLSKELRDRSIDLALQNAPFSRQISGHIPLGEYPMVWVAAPSVELPKCAVGIEDLAQYPVITHARHTRPNEEVTQHFGARRDLHPRLVQSNNVSASLLMCVDGLGIGTLPAAMLFKELASGELKRIDYAWTPEPLDFYARYDSEKSSAVVARAAEIAAEVSKAFRDSVQGT
jgi:DNA-binding transcriptional LysR family regulator